MPRLRSAPDTTALDTLAAAQAGAVSRSQAKALGMTDGQISRRLGGPWQRTDQPGVYLTRTGPVDHPARCWCALLWAGEGAVLSHHTALHLWGLRDLAPPTVDVTVPVGRRVRSAPGVRVHYALHLDDTRHPSRIPPVTRVEETVLDVVDLTTTRDTEIIDLVLRSVQRRRTEPDRLRSALERRTKIRRRELVEGLLWDARDGAVSPLERSYLHRVERSHGLPRGKRNRPEGSVGSRVYRDVRYPKYLLIVELDGAASHPPDRREDDDLRDNEVLLEEDVRTLRFGWRSVTVKPCLTAQQVVRRLRAGGWDGVAHRCGPGCLFVP
jgi:hypothetical protein